MRDFLEWIVQIPSSYIFLVAGNHDAALATPEASRILEKYYPRIVVLENSGCVVPIVRNGV